MADRNGRHHDHAVARRDARPNPARRRCRSSASLPEVVDDKGKAVPKNSGGKLVIRKPWPSMLRGIWGDPQRYKDTYWSEVKGSYFTGDGCRQDKDGYFWIVGRIDDVLNVAGHRIGTAEVESALVSNQKVAEAAVVGRPDELKGQALVAFVTLEDRRQGRPSIARRIAHIMSPRKSARWPSRMISVSPKRCPKRARAKSCAAC